MRIAVCDDEKIYRDQVLDVLEEYTQERKDRDVTFEIFREPKALLEAVRKNGHYDIYILDIVMPGMNGIELGQALRDDNCDSKIIYLTSSEEYALDSFRIRAFHYLLKPVQKQSLYEVLDEAISTISVKRDKSIIVKTKESSARITLDSILYAELSKRSVIYHLASGNNVTSTSLRTTFSEAVQELVCDRRFVMCGASMAVNLSRVTMVENEGIVFADNHKVFVGKKACREVRGQWNHYWLSQEGGI